MQRLHPTARAALLIIPLFLSGCEQDATELLEEINAAREGCTEEMLKASDEACVEMFERYAEMGEDAMETYVGGMRAFEEALRRRGGIQFDTAGLGHALTDSLYVFPRDTAPATDPVDSTVGIEPYPDSDGILTTPARWQRQQVTDPDSPGELLERGGRLEPELDRRPPSSGRTPPRRGALLAPEDRLRRPWIGDEAPADPYVEAEERRAPNRPEEAAGSGRWSDPPPEPPPPYPR